MSKLMLIDLSSSGALRVADCHWRFDVVFRRLIGDGFALEIDNMLPITLWHVLHGHSLIFSVYAAGCCCKRIIPRSICEGIIQIAFFRFPHWSETD